MLGKLLKHEFRATGRVFLPIYGAMVIVALVTRILDFVRNSVESHSSFSGGVPQGIGLSVTIMLIGAACVVALILTIQRFHKNLLGDEGYLMFTIPVGTDSLIFSKLIASVAWILASVLVALVALSIAIPGFFGGFIDVVRLFGREMSNQNASVWIAFVIAAFTGLLTIAYSSLMIYAASSLAMLSNSRRGLAAFGFWIVISIVAQVVTTTGITTAAHFNVMQLFDNAKVDTITIVVSVAMFLYALAGCAILYFITRIMLKKKLNLE